MARPITRITGIAAPLWVANINTDDIYPGPAASPVLRKSPAKSGGRDTAGDNAFAALRFDDALVPRPEFILNQQPYDCATILLVGANFGCGSSREVAVWALQGIGITCIVAPSFGEIFYDNCLKNSVLPAMVEDAAMQELIGAAKAGHNGAFTIDLEQRIIIDPDGKITPFAINDYPRTLLLEGQDEIDAACADLPTISAFAADYALRRPWLSAPATFHPTD